MTTNLIELDDGEFVVELTEVIISAGTGGAGVSDGTYGDVTISGSGTVMTVIKVGGKTFTTADAGADALFGWDDSANAYQNLSASDARAALGLTTPIAVASGGTGQTTEAEALGEMTQALTEDTTPDRANDFLMTYDASADTGKKAKIQTIADLEKDLSPSLSGQLLTGSHTIQVPAHTGEDHRSAGLDGAVAGGSAFNFRTPGGAKILELRYGDYKLGGVEPYDADWQSSYFFLSSNQAHTELLMGIDQDQPAGHHTRLGIKSLAGDPIAFHFDLDGPQTDYPYIEVFSNTDTGSATHYGTFLLFAAKRTTGGDNSLGTYGTTVPGHADDDIAYITFAANNSSNNQHEFVTFQVICDVVTAGAEVGRLNIFVDKGTGPNTGERFEFGGGGGLTLGQVATATRVAGPGIGNIKFALAGGGAKLNDVNNNELIKWASTVASAVNEFTISNAATGNGPSLAATGGDSNIDVVLTPKGTGRVKGVTESFILACSDETTALTTGTGKLTFRMPYAFTVTAVRASLTTAQTSGSIFTVDINEAGTTIISTKLTVDNTAKTSTTAATAAVISDAALADDAEITIDIDQVGDGTAKGLKVTIIGHQ